MTLPQRISVMTKAHLFWFALAVAACGGKKPVVSIDPMIDVSGQWQLNGQQSDNPTDKIAEARAAHGRPEGRSRGRRAPAGGTFGPGQPGGPGGMGGTPSMGGDGPPLNEKEMARRRARAELLMDLAQNTSDDLDVSVTPGAVRFVMHEALDTLALKTDGSKQKAKFAEGDDDVKVTTTAVWTEGRLVVTREVDGGGKITESYFRSPDGQHLYVAVHLELAQGRVPAVEFRRVYDPVKGFPKG